MIPPTPLLKAGQQQLMIDELADESAVASNWCEVTIESVPFGKQRQFIWDFTLAF